jgi:hypothetical protein
MAFREVLDPGTYAAEYGPVRLDRGPATAGRSRRANPNLSSLDDIASARVRDSHGDLDAAG